MEVKKSFKGEVAWPEIHTKVEAVLPLELIKRHEISGPFMSVFF
jgi:hypothetical protein